MAKYGLSFDLVDGGRDLRRLESFMLAQPGSYDPVQHEAWIEDVCIPGISSGNRRALAWYRHGETIGDAVLKVNGPDVAELKHFRVATADFAGRGLAGFLLKQATYEATELLEEQGMITSAADFIDIRLDTTAGGSAESFFLHQGFRKVGEAALYVPGRLETIMELTIPLH